MEFANRVSDADNVQQEINQHRPLTGRIYIHDGDDNSFVAKKIS